MGPKTDPCVTPIVLVRMRYSYLALYTVSSATQVIRNSPYDSATKAYVLQKKMIVHSVKCCR